MPRIGLTKPIIAVGLAFLSGTVLPGCEETGVDAPPAQTTAQTPPPETPPTEVTPGQGPSQRRGSTLGQAKSQAESLVDQLEQRDQDISDQIDKDLLDP